MITRWTSWLLGLIFLMTVMGPPAFAEGKRVALIIGNAGYKHAAELRNPRNDAQDVAEALQKLDFTVIAGFDLDHAGIRRSIGRFAVELENASVAVFYYAGHGIQIGGSNFLVPIDSKLENQYSPEFELIRIETVQKLMENKPRTSIIFLDSCRDNPLARNLARAMGTRSAGVQPGLSAAEAGIGTLISYSTQPGAVAQDGTGRNSPYAEALVRQLVRPGVAITDMLLDVRRNVMLATRDRQIPWEHSALRDRFYFSSPKLEPLVPPTAAKPTVEKEPTELTPTQKSALARRLNRELKRVGCDPGTSAGTWSASSQEALQLFAAATQHALYTDEPTQAALDALSSQKLIVCPLGTVVKLDRDKPVTLPDVATPTPKVEEAPKIEQMQPDGAALNKAPATAAAPSVLRPEMPPAVVGPTVPEKRPAPRPRTVPRAAAVTPPAAAPPAFTTKVERKKKCRLEPQDECLRRTGLSRSEMSSNCARREICE